MLQALRKFKRAEATNEKLASVRELRRHGREQQRTVARQRKLLEKLTCRLRDSSRRNRGNCIGQSSTGSHSGADSSSGGGGGGSGSGSVAGNSDTRGSVSAAEAEDLAEQARQLVQLVDNDSLVSEG